MQLNIHPLLNLGFNEESALSLLKAVSDGQVSSQCAKTLLSAIRDWVKKYRLWERNLMSPKPIVRTDWAFLFAGCDDGLMEEYAKNPDVFRRRLYICLFYTEKTPMRVALSAQETFTRQALQQTYGDYYTVIPMMVGDILDVACFNDRVDEVFASDFIKDEKLIQSWAKRLCTGIYAEEDKKIFQHLYPFTLEGCYRLEYRGWLCRLLDLDNREYIFPYEATYPLVCIFYSVFGKCHAQTLQSIVRKRIFPKDKDIAAIKQSFCDLAKALWNTPLPFKTEKMPYLKWFVKEVINNKLSDAQIQALFHEIKESGLDWQDAFRILNMYNNPPNRRCGVFCRQHWQTCHFAWEGVPDLTLWQKLVQTISPIPVQALLDRVHPINPDKWSDEHIRKLLNEGIPQNSNIDEIINMWLLEYLDVASAEGESKVRDLLSFLDGA